MIRRITAPRQRHPFEIGLIARGNHFADREEEVARIASVLQSPGSRLVVYGDRRLGKSSAVDRAAQVARKAKSGCSVSRSRTWACPLRLSERPERQPSLMNL